MPQLVGRETELAKLRAAYTKAATACAPGVVVVAGPGGIGKSALTRALQEFAQSQAVVLRTVAYPFDRLIPFALSARLPSLLDQLDRATRERPAVVIIDDAHHADDESLVQIAAMTQELSNRPLLVVLARDDEDKRALSIAADVTIALGELDSDSSYALARAHFPSGAPAVLDAIVGNAHGVPYELIAIAGAAARRGVTQPDAVDRSSGAAIAKDLAALPAPERLALQMLALLPEPVEPALLESPPPNFPIDHSLTAAAIVETIAMKIPLRRRIIDAIERRGLRTIRDRLLLAEQSLASGDGAFARATLLDLAFVAKAEHLVRVVVWASERHLELGEPPDERFVDFYVNFFEALMEEHSYARAESVAALALSEAQHRELPHLGSLAAQLVRAQWVVDRHEAARASYERYARAFEDPGDLQALHDAAPWLTAR
jgi:hypothetical protein